MTPITRQEPLIIAHRGASGYAPENTIAAFSKALKMGASAIEFDVQQTKDGSLVVIHDPDLRRVAGLKKKVGSMSYSELARVDVGSWFNPRFAGEKAPLLEEVLYLAERTVPGGVQLHLEIKNGAKPYDGIEDRVVELLNSHSEWNDRAIVSSFNHRTLSKIRLLDARIPLGYLVGWTRQAKALREAAELGCESVDISTRQVNRRWVEKVHAHGMKILVYTVNSAAQMERLRALGVDGIFTNFPDLATRKSSAPLSSGAKVGARG